MIDIITHWGGDTTKQVKETDFVYNYKGDIFYINDQRDPIDVYYKGYHKVLDSLRYETHSKD